MIPWKKRRIEAFEEVEYEPMTVLEILREMKDLSELATSLAYSAVLLDNDPIGEEVEALANRMDWLKYQMRLTGSLGVRSPEDAQQMSGVLQIADASEHIANAASDLIEILGTKLSARKLLGQALDEADDRIGTLRVPDDAPAVGQTLGGIGMESQVGVRVLAIRRGTRWVCDPGAEATLQAGDMLLIRGQRESSDHLRAWLAGEEDL